MPSGGGGAAVPESPSDGASLRRASRSLPGPDAAPEEVSAAAGSPVSQRANAVKALLEGQLKVCASAAFLVTSLP